MLKLKRAYEPFERSDGQRILIDRLWPRGLSKQKAHLQSWMKEIAPSGELRKRFHHDPDRWKEFKSAYLRELRSPEAKEKIREIARLASRGTVTLVYSAKNEKMNDAVVLKERILKEAGRAGKKSA